jgi:transposase
MRVVVDYELYSMRNLVKRCFNKLKDVRCVATRYDKTAEGFRCSMYIMYIRVLDRVLST